MMLPTGPQDRLMPKLGGLPWGLPQEAWPHCVACGQATHLLAQMPPETPGVGDLNGDVLHIFACRWMDSCDNLYNEPGHDAVLRIKQSDMGTGLTPFPWTEKDDVLPDGLSKSLTPIQPWGGQVRARCVAAEFWITGFNAFDDAVPEDMEDAFYDAELFWALTDKEASPHDFDSRYQTKFGGAPYWSGDGPGPNVTPDMRQLLQLDGYITLSEATDPGLEPYDQFSDTGHPLSPMYLDKSSEDGHLYASFDASPFEGGSVHVMTRSDGTHALIETR